MNKSVANIGQAKIHIDLLLGALYQGGNRRLPGQLQ